MKMTMNRKTNIKMEEEAGGERGGYERREEEAKWCEERGIRNEVSVKKTRANGIKISLQEDSSLSTYLGLPNILVPGWPCWQYQWHWSLK
jgi:hypothetical protein